MKMQKFDCITNKELQELNKQGWYIKQVIGKLEHQLMCEPDRYFVLLENDFEKE